MRIITILFYLVLLQFQSVPSALAQYVFNSTDVTQSFHVTSQKLEEDSPAASDVAAKEAVVVGAGPAGLISALILRQQGYKVVVMEKRSTDFSRMNMVNLKVESESILHELGILEEFQEKVGSRIDHHRIHAKTTDGIEAIVDREVVGDLPPSRDVEFVAEKSGEVFGPSGLYTISIGQLQQFLAQKAQERGIPIYGETKVELTGEDKKSVKATQGASEKTYHPNLIVLADGAGGDTGGATPALVQLDHPCHREHWVFGNVKYSGTVPFVNVLLDYTQESGIEISNSIFNPKFHQVNIAVSVTEDELTVEEINHRLEEVAKKVFAINGLSDEPKVDILSDQIVKITNRIAEKFTNGSNVVLAGDRAGVSSPLAGLGASLALTSYAYGIKQLGKAIQEATSSEEVTVAMKKYEDDAKVYTDKWLKTSSGVKQFIVSKKK